MSRLHALGSRLVRRLPSAVGPRPSQGSRKDLDYLFIVTYGKSGSTLLMGVLNSLPGHDIRGENGGVLYDLYQYHSKAVRFRDQWSSGQPLPAAHPWYGIDGYPAELGLTGMRQLVLDTLLRPEPGTTVSGFKEIRWWMDDPVDYLDFIQSLFPGARFILNTRNLADVAKSSWYRKNPASLQRLESLEPRLKDAVATRGDSGYHVHYDDYVHDHSILKGLCDWVGVPHDAERIDEVFQTRYSTRAGSA